MTQHKNKILIGLSLLALTGLCFKLDQPKLGVLKAPKEKIIAYHTYKQIEWRKSTSLGGTSTPKLEPVSVDMVEYNYVSTEMATRTPYWSKDNTISNAVVLPKRPDGLQPIAFHAQAQFYKDLGITYNVKYATATLIDFQKLTGITVADRIRSFFFDTALATTTFSASSTYTPDATGNITILVIGGGGGGGQYDAGGGGAGGYIASSSLAVISGTGYTVTVGAGGIGGAGGTNPNRVQGITGGTSTFGGLVTSTGGGGGGTYQGPMDGVNAGSGGGGSHTAGAGGTGIAGQGNNGGGVDGNGGAGGGGGSASVGKNALLTVSGDGGLGTTSTITGSAVCRAGGGGGGDDGGITGGNAGCGGGAGGVQVVGTSGTNGTGGGGGGGGGNSGGGRGGDGVIIIAFNSTTPAVVIKPTAVIIQAED